MTNEWVVKALWKGNTYIEPKWMYLRASRWTRVEPTLVEYRGDAVRLVSEMDALERGCHYRDLIKAYKEFEVEEIIKPKSFKTDTDRAADAIAAER